MNIEPAALIGAISFLCSVIGVIARTAYVEMRAERDWLRREVLSTLASMAERAASARIEQEAATREITIKMDGLRRIVTRKDGGTST